MVRYLIKSVSVATEENENFKGRVTESVYGKGDRQLRHCGGLWDHDGGFDLMTPHMIREYGYTRKCDAVRSWIYKNPQNDKFWRTEVEIITVDVD